MDLTDKLFDSYFQKKISKNEMLMKLGVYESDFYKALLYEIKEAYRLQNAIRLEKLIWALDICKNEKSNKQCLESFSDIFNRLLICDWHNQHEVIVMILEEISNIESLDYLYQAIELKREYLSWDDNYSFEVKCVRAIYYVGKERAIPYLKKLSNHENARIREIAKKQLNKMNKGYLTKNKNIRAVYTNNTIRVYQAYNRLIADEAVRMGTFGDNFKMDRMTWIKPSFLWMMYRCGWAQKENQERVLAIDIKREGFDYLVKTAVSSTYQEEIYGSHSYWSYRMRNSDILYQWDPERDIYGNPLETRSLQLGLRGEAIKKYVHEWIISITDITDYVLNLKEKRDMKQNISDLLPQESVYCV